MWIVLHHTYAYAHWWSKIHYGYGEKCSKTCIKQQGLLPFIYRHNYGYFSGRSYCTRVLGCCSIFIALQQLKVFLFPYTTNTFKAVEKVRIAPGHTSWWSSDHALSRLYRACFRVRHSRLHFIRLGFPKGVCVIIPGIFSYTNKYMNRWHLFMHLLV